MSLVDPSWCKFDCNQHGDCLFVGEFKEEQCRCHSGFKGEYCQEVEFEVNAGTDNESSFINQFSEYRFDEESNNMNDVQKVGDTRYDTTPPLEELRPTNLNDDGPISKYDVSNSIKGSLDDRSKNGEATRYDGNQKKNLLAPTNSFINADRNTKPVGSVPMVTKQESEIAKTDAGMKSIDEINRTHDTSRANVNNKRYKPQKVGTLHGPGTVKKPSSAKFHKLVSFVLGTSRSDEASVRKVMNHIMKRNMTNNEEEYLLNMIRKSSSAIDLSNSSTPVEPRLFNNSTETVGIADTRKPEASSGGILIGMALGGLLVLIIIALVYIGYRIAERFRRRDRGDHLIQL